jgi:hypothetical protein
MYDNHRGPIVENIYDDLYLKYSYPLPMKYRENHTITINAAIFDPDSTSLKGLVNLAFSKDSEEFTRCSNFINAPNIDSVFINKTG